MKLVGPMLPGRQTPRTRPGGSWPSDERGSALVAVLILAAVMVPIGTWATWQARVDAAVARNLRGDLHSFYVADAGLNHALAVVTRLPSPAAALAGPDGVPGTADDGGVVGPAAVRTIFPEAPYGYLLDVQAVGIDGVRIRSTGAGWDGATKQLEAVVFWRGGKAYRWWREIL